ncbi:hypothetical protein HDU96_001132 [Phlyctochytrium bullatum]|nr:hypothetical protein HDU96_001132 [Phlyctochytrium bullatum]
MVEQSLPFTLKPFLARPSLAPKDFLGLFRHRSPSVSTTSVRSFDATAPVAPPFSFQLFVGQLKQQVSLPACVFVLGNRLVLIFARSLVPKSTSRSRPLSLLEAFRLYPREEFAQGLELARLIKRGDNLFAARQVFAADSAGRSRRRDDLTASEIQQLLKEIGQLLRRFEKYNQLLKDEYQFAPIIFVPRQLANREREPDVYDRQLQDCAAFAKRIVADARNHLFQLITKGFHLFRDRLHGSFLDTYQRDASRLSDVDLEALGEEIIPRLTFHERYLVQVATRGNVSYDTFNDACRRYFAPPLPSQASCLGFIWKPHAALVLRDGDGDERTYLRKPISGATLAPAPKDGPASRRRRRRGPKGERYINSDPECDSPPPPPSRTFDGDYPAHRNPRVDADGDITLPDVDDGLRSVVSVNSSTASLRAAVNGLGLNACPAIDTELAPNIIEAAQLPSLELGAKPHKTPPRHRTPGPKITLRLGDPPATKEAAKELREESRAKLAAADSAISPRLTDPAPILSVASVTDEAGQPNSCPAATINALNPLVEPPAAEESPLASVDPDFPPFVVDSTPEGSPVTPSAPPPASHAAAAEA